MNESAPAAEFRATRWSLVYQAAQSSQPERAAAALAELYRGYQYPLYVFARDRGRRSAEDAGDLVQDFFVRVLEKNVLGAADPARGRFRSFLLGAFKNLIVTQWRDANRQKRGGGAGHVSLDFDSAETRYATESLADTAASPDETYDIQWARALVDGVLGPEHPDTLGSRNNLAEVLRAQGKNAEAEAEHRAVLAVMERVPGPEHPDTLVSHYNLALCLEAQADEQSAAGDEKAAQAGWQDALSHAEAAQRGGERVLGAQHPDQIDYNNKVQDLQKKLSKPKPTK